MIQVPQQTNGYDCGVFASQFGAAVVRGRSLDVKQDDIEMLRKTMVVELATGLLAR